MKAVERASLVRGRIVIQVSGADRGLADVG